MIRLDRNSKFVIDTSMVCVRYRDQILIKVDSNRWTSPGRHYGTSCS